MGVTYTGQEDFKKIQIYGAVHIEIGAGADTFCLQCDWKETYTKKSSRNVPIYISKYQ